MKTTLRILAVAVIAGGTMLAQPRVAIGIGVGGYGPGYYAPPAYAQYMPPCPGPDYVWVDGYWIPRGGRNVWVNGYWHRRYGYGVAPGYVAPRYYNSYRGYDRGYGNRYQYRGGAGHEDRGRGYANGFRR